MLGTYKGTNSIMQLKWLAYKHTVKGVVTVLVAICNATREAPAYGCGESLVTNDETEGRPQQFFTGWGGNIVTNYVRWDFAAHRERWR